DVARRIDEHARAEAARDGAALAAAAAELAEEVLEARWVALDDEAVRRDVRDRGAHLLDGAHRRVAPPLARVGSALRLRLARRAEAERDVDREEDEEPGAQGQGEASREIHDGP